VPENFIIIVAGGIGSRVNNELPKQFIKLNEKEIIIHTIQKFLDFDPAIKIIIAVHENFIGLLEQILKHHQIKNVIITKGGETRFQSVKNSLTLITDLNSIIGIHDAARPLVSLQTIKTCYQTAVQKGNATPAVTITETIREDINGNNRSANRNNYKIIQTPQCFIAKEIKNAFELPFSENFTDDASVLEASGIKINLVEGNVENIKITYSRDLIIAKALLSNM